MAIIKRGGGSKKTDIVTVCIECGERMKGAEANGWSGEREERVGAERECA